MSTTIKIAIMVCLFLVGFGLGTTMTRTSIKTEYIKGETIIDSIPYAELKPVIVELPGETIYIEDVEYLKSDIDTAKIIAEYIKIKRYEQVLFDSDTLGMVKINLSVAYNSLRCLSYEFTPVTKHTTITKLRTYTPYLSTSINSFGIFGVGGGMYKKNVGYGLKYITDLENNGIEFSLNYKF